MSTMSVHHRPGRVRRPVYRRPEWSELSGADRSNTWGHGAVFRASPVSRARQHRGVEHAERPFESGRRGARLRRRVSMVVGSPGTTLVSVAAVAMIVAAAPAVTGQDEGVVTPRGTTTVTVGAGLSLSEIAEAHVPGAPTGDAVARIASLNDVSDGGRELVSSGGETREVVVPVY